MLFSSPSHAKAKLAADWRWPNFSVEELACQCAGRYCGGAYWHAPVFLDALQELRNQIRRPLIVTSGHRCSLWNAQVGGAPLSQHKTIAVDLSLRGHNRDELLACVKDCGFTGLGLARTFIHLDRRTKPTIWFYPGSRHLWQI